MITTANVITFCISIFAILVTIYNVVKNGTKENTGELTTVIVGLENIKDGVSEIKRDMKDMREEIRGIDKRVTRLETVIEEEK